jgi:hypothetical protein
MGSRRSDTEVARFRGLLMFDDEESETSKRTRQGPKFKAKVALEALKDLAQTSHG